MKTATIKIKTKTKTRKTATTSRRRRMTSSTRPAKIDERRDDNHGPMRAVFEAAVDLAATTVKEVAALSVVAGRATGRVIKENAARMMQPKAEMAYWRKQYKKRPYYRPGQTYAYYQAAYRYGYENAKRYAGKNYDDVVDQLKEGWADMKEQSTLTWDAAREAVRDAWDRATDNRPR